MKLQNISRVMILACFLVVPLFFWGGARSEVYRVWLVLFLVDIAVITSVVGTFGASVKNGWFAQLFSSQKLLLIFGFSWLAVVFISILLNGSFQTSFIGSYFRGDGLVLQLHGAAVVYLIAQQSHMWIQKKMLPMIAIAAWIVATLIVLQASSQYVRGDAFGPLWPGGGFAATLQNPSLAGGYLIVTWVIALYVAANLQGNRAQILRVGLFLLQAVAIVLTQSWIAVTLSLFITGAWYFRNRISTKVIAVWIVCAVLVFWGSVILIGDAYSSVDNRRQIYQQVSVAVEQKPWIGWGWARFSEQKTSLPVVVDHAHAGLFEILVSAGLVGGVMYVLGLGAVWLTLEQKFAAGPNKKVDYWWAWLLTGAAYFVVSQTNVTSVVAQLIFWSVIGVALRLEKPKKS